MDVRPILNWENMPCGDMLRKLAVFEALCNARGLTVVPEDDVRAFLREEGREDLARDFSPSFFRGAPQ